MSDSGFDETPEISAFLGSEATGDSRGLTPLEVREVLEEAFLEARIRKEKSNHPTSEKLELHEKVLLRADAVQILVERGRIGFEAWCVEKELHPGEYSTLYTEAMATIRELTDASAEDHLSTARARYEDLFQRLHRRGEYKEASQVQSKLDKLNQLGGSEDNDVLGGLRRSIEKLTRPMSRPERPSPAAERAE